MVSGSSSLQNSPVTSRKTAQPQNQGVQAVKNAEWMLPPSGAGTSSSFAGPSTSHYQPGISGVPPHPVRKHSHKRDTMARKNSARILVR